MATRFEIVQNASGNFLFQLRSAAGEVLLTSLTSNSKIMTQNELLHLRRALPEASSLVPHNSDGGHFLVVKDHDGTVLAKSVRTGTEAERDALAAEIRSAVSAPMVDLTKRSASVG